MKKHFFYKLTAFLIFSLILIFSGCSNFLNLEENLPVTNNQPGQTEAAAVMVNADKSVTLTGNYFTQDGFSRSAFPQLTITNDGDVYKMSVTASASGVETVTGTIDDSAGTYSLKLKENGTYTITLTVQKYTQTVSDVKQYADFLSGSTTITLTDGTVTGNLSIYLSAVDNSDKTGTVSLPVTVDSASGITSAVVSWNSGGTACTQTLSFDASNLERTFTLIDDASSLTAAACGIYNVTFNFYVYNSELGQNDFAYSFTESVTVLMNCETSTWINASGAPYIDSGKIRITSSLIAATKLTSFCVDSTNGSDTTGDGSFFNPLKTLNRAYSIINSVNDQTTLYTIYLTADYDGSAGSLETDIESAKNNLLNIAPDNPLNLLICGNPSATPVMSIDASSVSDARIFYVSPKVSLTLQNIKLTGVNLSGVGGAVYCNGNLTIGNGVEITGNTAWNASAVYFDASQADETLTISGGYIHDNTVTTKSMEIYVVETSPYSAAFELSGSSILSGYTYLTNASYVTLGNLTGTASDQKFKLILNSFVEDSTILTAGTGVTISSFNTRFTLYKKTGESAPYMIDEEGLLKPLVYSDWDTLCAAVDAIPTGTTTATTFYIKNPSSGNLVVNNQPLGNLCPVVLKPYGNTGVTLERASDYTGKIFNPSAALTLEGSSTAKITVDGKSVTASYPAVYVYDSDLTLSYVDFTKCASDDDGTCIYLYDDAGTVKIKNCTFTDNNTKGSMSYGGAIYSDSDTNPVEITDCTFTGNSAYAGGAIAVKGEAAITIKDSAFTGNSSTDNGYDCGSAVFFFKGDLTLDGVTMSNNVNSLSNPSDLTVEISSGIAPKVLFKNKCTIPMVYYDYDKDNGYPYGPFKLNNITDSSIKVKLAQYTYTLANYKVIEDSSDSSANLTSVLPYIQVADSPYEFTSSGYVTKALVCNSDGFFEIGDFPELSYMRDSVNAGENITSSYRSTGTPLSSSAKAASYIVTADIDCGSDSWTPIYITDDDVYYTGTFDGDEHQITYSSTSTSAIVCQTGLFGYTGEGSVIKDLNVKATVSTTTSKYTGGIVSYCAGTIQNCNVKESAISGIYYVGGIAGGCASKAVIKDCTTDAATTVTGVSSDVTSVGGITGFTKYLVQGCVNNAAVSSSETTSYMLGGIAGYQESGTISGCVNNGEISSEQAEAKYYGGIVGSSIGGTITECTNKGNIKAGWFVGGIAGTGGTKNTDNQAFLIDKCSNTGNVEGTKTSSSGALSNDAGGIAGQLLAVQASANIPVIRNCWNSGNVKIPESQYSQYAGGICGNMQYGNVDNCYNLGDVSGGINIGGIMGAAVTNQACQNFYSKGKSSGTNYVGIICGYFSGSISDYFYKAEDTTSAVNFSGTESHNYYQSYDTSYNLSATTTILGSSCTTLLEALNAWLNVWSASDKTLYSAWKTGDAGYPVFEAASGGGASGSGNVVYLNVTSGSDSNSGTTSEAPVKTVSAAKALLNKADGCKLVLLGPLTDPNEISSLSNLSAPEASSGYNAILEIGYEAANNTDRPFTITYGSAVTLNNLTIKSSADYTHKGCCIYASMGLTLNNVTIQDYKTDTTNGVYLIQLGADASITNLTATGCSENLLIQVGSGNDLTIDGITVTDNTAIEAGSSKSALISAIGNNEITIKGNVNYTGTNLFHSFVNLPSSSVVIADSDTLALVSGSQLITIHPVNGAYITDVVLKETSGGTEQTTISSGTLSKFELCSEYSSLKKIGTDGKLTDN